MCPECGLTTTDHLEIVARRADCRRKVPWIAGGWFIGPLLLGVSLRYVGEYFGVPSLIIVSGLLWVVWFLMLWISLPLSYICSRSERALWTYMSFRVLPTLAAPLLLVPINVVIHSSWVMVVLTGLSISVSNVLAWRIRRRTRERLMLRSSIAATISLLLHVCFAIVIAAITILGAIGREVFVLPGQQ